MTLKTRRRVLLCAVGLNPQAVTHILYALARQAEPWVPDEIRLITTAKGRERARKKLLREAHFHRLRQALGIEHIDFSPAHIKAITLRGRHIEDIASIEENTAAGDFICREILDLTGSGDRELHIALSAGRHTMSFFAGYALSRLSQPHHLLSHVVLADEVRTDPEFYFPDEQYRARYPQLNDNDWIRVANVPFARISQLVSLRLSHKHVDYGDLCRVLDEPPRLQVTADDRATHLILSDVIKISCDSRHTRAVQRVQPRAAALYILYAKRKLAGLGPLTDAELIAEPGEYLNIYEQLLLGESGNIEIPKEERDLNEGILGTTRTRVNSALRRALPTSDLYFEFKVHRTGKNRGYALSLDAQQVRLPADLS